MKNSRNLLIIATLIVGFSPAIRVSGGGDGVVASPRLRQQINERVARRTPADTNVTVTQTETAKPKADRVVVASPRLRQQINERSNARFQVAPVK